MRFQGSIPCWEQRQAPDWFGQTKPGPLQGSRLGLK